MIRSYIELTSCSCWIMINGLFSFSFSSLSAEHGGCYFTTLCHMDRGGTRALRLVVCGCLEGEGIKVKVWYYLVQRRVPNRQKTAFSHRLTVWKVAAWRGSNPQPFALKALLEPPTPQDYTHVRVIVLWTSRCSFTKLSEGPGRRSIMSAKVHHVSGPCQLFHKVCLVHSILVF